MAIAAPATTYCTVGDVADLLSQDGIDGRVDDDADGTITARDQARQLKATYYATAECERWLLGRYDRANLAISWVVNDWATALAAEWLCHRRGNPVPGSLATRLKEVIRPALKAVHDGESNLDSEEVFQRVSDAPAWSNVRVDYSYGVRKIRVERVISEDTPAVPGRQNIDLGSEMTNDTF